MRNPEEAKKDYQFFKAHGICVNCHRENAAPNRVRCPACLQKATDSRHKKLETATQEQILQKCQYMCNYNKQRRDRLRAAGICIVCGRNPSGKFCLCFDCRMKRHQRKETSTTK